MADKPILFSAPMVRALLEGRKTQTRRVLKPQPDDLFEGQIPDGLRISIGDRLWVREAWIAQMNGGWTIADARRRIGLEKIFYRADDDKSIDGWWPSIHMPREFSRLTLIVENVRVERLQDISEADAKAEGVEPLHHGFFPYGITTFMTVMQGDREVPAQCTTNAKDSFGLLWNLINGPGAWDANPWVVAYTFRVIKANIDSAEARP